MPDNILRKCINPIFDAYTLPSNPMAFIHQHCTQEIFTLGQIWFIELNRTEHFSYRFFFLMACWALSVIYSLRFVLPSRLAGLCVPGCHRGWVVWPILTWLLVMSSTTINILCPLFPREKEGSDFHFLSVLFLPNIYLPSPGPSAVILSQFCTSGFLSHFLMSAGVLESLEWLKWR